MSNQYKCIVNKIIYERGDSMAGITTGVKQYEQYKYEYRYKGGNGTYVTDYYNIPSELKAKIYVCKLNRYVYLDIKERVLEVNNRQRISDKLVRQLHNLNKGSRIWFDFIDKEGLNIENSKKNIDKLKLAV